MNQFCFRKIFKSVFLFVFLIGYSLIPTASFAIANNTNTIDSLNNLAYSNIDINYPKALSLATKALHLATLQHYTKGITFAICTQSIAMMNTNQCKTALAKIDALSQESFLKTDTALFIHVCKTKGLCYYNYEEYDSAEHYYQQALQLIKLQKQKQIDATIYIQLSRTNLKLGLHNEAVRYYNIANSLLKKKAKPNDMAWLQFLYCELFYSQLLYSKSLEQARQSYATFKQLNNIRGVASSLLMKGNAYYMSYKDDSAKFYYQNALQNFQHLGDSSGTAICLSNLSRVFLELRNYQQAIYYAEQALKTIGTGNYLSLEAGTYQQLGDIYGELNQLNKAIFYVNKAIQTGRKSDNKIIIKDCYKSLSELYAAQKQPTKAYENLLAAYRIKDSIQPLEFNRQLAKMQALYQAEKKEARIKLLVQQKQIDVLKMQKQESSIKKQKLLLLLLAVIIIAVVVVVYFYISRLRLLEQVRQREVIRDTEEHERQRIAKDIHDDFGSGLSKIKFLSELAKTQSNTTPSEIKHTLSAISTASVTLIENMRDLVWTMKPENSTLDSLVARLREYAYDYVEDFPIHLQFTTTDNIPSTLISKSVSRNVQMIFKEALQNIVKHASAKNIKITLTIGPRFELNIHDDGKGFSPQIIKEGNGLKNMQQRSEAIGATLLLETEENKGTSICLTLDLDK